MTPDDKITESMAKFAAEQEARYESDPIFRKLTDIGEPPGPGKITQEWLADAYSKGLIPKKDLKHGKYYAGDSRQATVARWNSDLQVFEYQRTKFRDVFTDTVEHPEDDRGFTVFIAVAEVEPKEEEKVP